MSQSYQLRSFNENPPGNFFYLQTEGVSRKFDATPVIEHLAANVASFRRGNKLPRASEAEAMADIQQFTCARLRNNPRWCVPCDGEPALAANIFEAYTGGKGCTGCGGTPTP